jgi:hypothetical protein
MEYLIAGGVCSLMADNAENKYQKAMLNLSAIVFLVIGIIRLFTY